MLTSKHCSICRVPLVPDEFTFAIEIDSSIVRHTQKNMPKCPQCGCVVFSMHQMQVFEMEAAQMMLACERKLSGKALRYVRRALGKSRRQWGDILGVDVQQVERWEHNHQPFPEDKRIVVGSLLEDSIHPG